MNIILDTNIIIAYPKLLGLKMDNVSFVVPIDVISELNEKAAMRGKSYDERVELIEKGQYEGTITVINTDLPGFHKYINATSSIKLSRTDSAVLATAMYFIDKKGEQTSIATFDNYITDFAEGYGIEVLSHQQIDDLIKNFDTPDDKSDGTIFLNILWEITQQTINGFFPFRQLFKILEEATSIQGKIVLFERKETANLFAGILIGIISTILVAVLYFNISTVIASINVWGTIIVTLVLGVILFILREKQRLAYGIFEFSIGVLSIIILFYGSHFDYSEINFSMDFNLKIAAGLYIMVRGQDNMVKAIKDSKLGLKLKRFGIGN